MKHLLRSVANIVFFAFAASCTPRIVPVHHYHETERVKVERDSIHYTDTVRIAERGDTVLVEVTKWCTRYRTTTDTLRRVDTVQLPPKLIAQPEKRRIPWLAYIVTTIFIVMSLTALYLAVKSR